MNRYILYARKSSESEDRQVQSIDDQLRVLREKAKDMGLIVVKEITESRSAKEPGQREGFERVVQMIEDGEADGILCWNINRLSRNPVESGRIQWLLQQRTLSSIQTYEKEYRPEDNVLMFKVESGIAEQYILDLSKVVRRGIENKVLSGGYPQRAPDGYINNLYSHTIEADPERFSIIRRAWEMFLTGNYTVEQVMKQLNEWGYTTRKARKIGGGPLLRSTAYRLFGNIFYTGYFMYKGELHQGNYPAMISMEEYEKAQSILHRYNQRRPSKHNFAFTGLIFCARCGRQITAEKHAGRHRRGNYVYYRCSNSRRCSSKAVREEVIEKEIGYYLNRVAIHPKFLSLMREWIDSRYAEESNKEEETLHIQYKAIEEVQAQKSNLIRLSINSMISDEDFQRERSSLEARLTGLKKESAQAEKRLERARNETLAIANFVTKAPFEFANTSPDQKKLIARKLGVKYFLDDGKLVTELDPLLVPIYQHKFEPLKNGSAKEKEPTNADSLSLGWG